MKKFILTLAVVVTTLCSFAADKEVNVVVLKSFNKEFSGAKQVQWSASGDYYKASFLFNDQCVFAFFSQQGELMGVTRNLTSLELPVPLQSGLKRDYAGYWITNLFEISNDDGVHYYITVENADSKIILNSTGSAWKSYKKASKI